MEELRQRMIKDGLSDLAGMTADFPFVDNHCQTLGVDSGSMSARFIVATNKGPNRKNARLSLVKTRNGGGILRDNYDRNPVCCFDHGLNPFVSVPIGTSRNPDTGEVDLKITKSKAVGTVHFSQSLPQAEQIFRLIDEGIIRGSSVMLRPMKADLTEFSEDEDDESSFVLDIYESDLLEFGPVGIGADPDAIRSSIDSGNYNHVKNWLMMYAAQTPVQGVGIDTESFASNEPNEGEKSMDHIEERLERIEQSISDLADQQAVRFGEPEPEEKVEKEEVPESVEFTSKLEELNEVCSRQGEALHSLYTRLGGL